MPSGNLHPTLWVTLPNSLGLILWKINLPLSWKLIFSKRYHSWWPSKFFKTYISVVGNHLTIIFNPIIIRLILNKFLKTLHILQKIHQSWKPKFWLPNMVLYQTDKAPLLCHIKLCASFRSHLWIQIGVTIWKFPNWHKICFDLCALDFRPLTPFAWTSLLSIVTTPENFVRIL